MTVSRYLVMMVLVLKASVAVVPASLAADDQPVTTYFNPQKGLQIISSIPKKYHYNIFCGFPPGEPHNVDEDRKRGCALAISALVGRLRNLADGYAENPVDGAFIDHLQHLATYPEQSRRVTVKSQVRHGVVLNNRAAVDELLRMVSTVYHITGVDILGHESCLDTDELASRYKYYELSGFASFPLALKNFNKVLYCQQERDNAHQCELPPYSSNLERLQAEDIADWKEQVPYPVRLMSREQLLEAGFLYVYGLAAPLIDYYVAEFSRHINQILAGATWRNQESLDTELQDLSKYLFVVHPYGDGNSRASRLLMNYMRLVMGLQPLEMEYISSPSKGTAIEQNQSFHFNSSPLLERWLLGAF